MVLALNIRLLCFEMGILKMNDKINFFEALLVNLFGLKFSQIYFKYW